MAPYSQINSYLQNHYEGMTPEQLILALYNGAISRLKLARKGVRENDIKMRGENLSKAIAIISELNASIDPEMNDETAGFLRGLYTAILTELPKVSLNNDVEIIDRAEAYITRLKEIWENDVMAESSHPAKKKGKNGGTVRSSSSYGSGFGNGEKKKSHSISV
ncbi:MAG: flagellar export chaperone FliS [Desulfobacteraceae bacterium]